MKQVIRDSGIRTDIDFLSYAPYLELRPRTRYYWDVSVLDDKGDRGRETSWFETGKLEEVWHGRWIGCHVGKWLIQRKIQLWRSIYIIFRKEFFIFM